MGSPTDVSYLLMANTSTGYTANGYTHNQWLYLWGRIMLKKIGVEKGNEHHQWGVTQ